MHEPACMLQLQLLLLRAGIDVTHTNSREIRRGKLSKVKQPSAPECSTGM
jgi:hypothetical protein